MKHVTNQLFGKYYQLAVGEKALKQAKLVMTLLARDEADIIEANIQFHLTHGVDFIVATDNGSCDGTTGILEKYQKQGVLHLIHEPSRVMDQAGWVNRMGCIALDKYKADFIFHCDADEFWYPRSGSLKRELLARPRVDVLSVNLVNILMKNRNGDEVFPGDAIYAVTNPLQAKSKQRDVDNTSFLLFKYPKKVIYKLGKGYLPVTTGNHRIERNKALPTFRKAISHDIEIFHFPIRGIEQFARKAINGGEAREQLDFAGNQGWHIKRWLELSRAGKLLEEYNRLNLSDAEAERLLKDGVVTTKDERHQELIAFLSQFENQK